MSWIQPSEMFGLARKCVFRELGPTFKNGEISHLKNAKRLAPFGKWEALVAWSPHSHSVTIIRHTFQHDWQAPVCLSLHTACHLQPAHLALSVYLPDL